MSKRLNTSRRAKDTGKISRVGKKCKQYVNESNGDVISGLGHAPSDETIFPSLLLWLKSANKLRLVIDTDLASPADHRLELVNGNKPTGDVIFSLDCGQRKSASCLWLENAS
jgi:hypothetical protein